MSRRELWLLPAAEGVSSYPLAGEGFRKLLHARIWAYDSLPDPRRPDSRLP